MRDDPIQDMINQIHRDLTFQKDQLIREAMEKYNCDTRRLILEEHRTLGFPVDRVRYSVHYITDAELREQALASSGL